MNVDRLTREQIAVMPLVWGAFVIRPEDPKYTDVYEAPNEPGIYAWYTEDRELMYIGRSVGIANRLIQHNKRTFFHLGYPTFYSYRLVPECIVAAVEMAHIRTLAPAENRSVQASGCDFMEPLMAAIDDAWKDVYPAQQASLGAKYTRIAEQIASRL